MTNPQDHQTGSQPPGWKSGENDGGRERDRALSGADTPAADPAGCLPLTREFTQKQLHQLVRSFVKNQYATIYGESINAWPVDVQEKFFCEFGRFMLFVFTLFPDEPRP